MEDIDEEGHVTQLVQEGEISRVGGDIFLFWEVLLDAASRPFESGDRGEIKKLLDDQDKFKLYVCTGDELKAVQGQLVSFMS